jgi:hypothetical protein
LDLLPELETRIARLEKLLLKENNVDKKKVEIDLRKKQNKQSFYGEPLASTLKTNLKIARFKIMSEDVNQSDDLNLEEVLAPIVEKAVESAMPKRRKS